MKNKKADISITILVLGVVAISILTIFSFINSRDNIEEDFLGIGLIETINSIEEEINFYGETDFESGDYENVFDGGNVVIKDINSNRVTGTYTKNGKTLVRVIYTK
jgi:hypothetical protein